MKTKIAVGVLLLSMFSAFAQEGGPVIQTTKFSADFLRSKNAAEAAAKMGMGGLTNSVGTLVPADLTNAANSFKGVFRGNADRATLAGDTNAVDFILQQGITESDYQQNVKGFVGDQKNWGLFSNLIDRAVFMPWANPATNKTFFGANIVVSNASYGANGLHFSGNSQVWFPAIVPPTNFIVLVWRATFTNSTGFGLLAGLYNTNNHTSESIVNQGGINYGLSYLNVKSNTIPWPAVSSQSNLLFYPLCVGQSALWNLTEERRVTILAHDGRGNFRLYNQGSPCQINNLSPTFVQSASPFPATNFNAVFLGKPFSTNGESFGAIVGGWVGDIESISLYRGLLTSNMVIKIGQSLKWEVTNTVENYWVGDSRMMGNSYSNNMATMMWNSPKLAGALNYVAFGGGTKIGQYVSSFALTNTIYNQGQPHGNVKEAAVYVAAEVNDSFGSGTSGAQSFTDLTNFLAPAFENSRFKTFVWDEMQTGSSTNSLYNQTGVTEQRRQAFNALIYANSKLFTRVLLRDQFVTQEMLDTNRFIQLSTDYIHFNNPIMGDSVYEMLAKKALEDFPLPSSSPGLAVNIGDAGRKDGLLMAYSFSEGIGGTVKDDSGNGVTLFCTNSVPVWTNAGCYGYAPIFNGLTWFKANSNGVFHSNLRSLTASCWLSMPTHRQFDMIAAVSDSAVSIPGTWCLYVFDEKKIGWVMQTTGGRVEARGGNVTLTNSGWHHIAGTYDGVTLTLYIDGLAVTNRPLTGSLTPNFLPFTIGTCANLNLGNVTNGIIDDFKLWNRGLSADEIFAEWKSKDKGIVSASVGGYSVTNIFSVLTSLSFGAISPASESTVALTIQNLKNTDSVTATPTNFPPAGVIFVAWPSNNTAFVRARNFSTNSVDPSGYFRLSVIQ